MLTTQPAPWLLWPDVALSIWVPAISVLSSRYRASPVSEQASSGLFGSSRPWYCLKSLQLMVDITDCAEVCHASNDAWSVPSGWVGFCGLLPVGQVRVLAGVLAAAVAPVVAVAAPVAAGVTVSVAAGVAWSVCAAASAAASARKPAGEVAAGDPAVAVAVSPMAGAVEGAAEAAEVSPIAGTVVGDDEPLAPVAPDAAVVGAAPVLADGGT